MPFMCMNNLEMYVAQQQYNSWAQATLTVAIMDPATWLMGANLPLGCRLYSLGMLSLVVMTMI